MNFASLYTSIFTEFLFRCFQDNHSKNALDVFHECIDFSLEGSVPKPRKFAQLLRDKVAGMEDFLVTEEDQQMILEIEEAVGVTLLIF